MENEISTINPKPEIEKPTPTSTEEVKVPVPDSVEEKKSLAKVLLAQEQSLEAIIEATGLSRQAVNGLKGSLVKANQRLEQASSLPSERLKGGLGQTDYPASQSEAEIKPESANQAIPSDNSEVSRQPSEGEIPLNLHTRSFAVSPSGATPPGYVAKPALTTDEWKVLSGLDKMKLIAMVADLKATNSSLQAQAVTSRGNGNANSGEAEVDRQKALLYKTIRESVELQQLQNLANMNKPSQQASASPQNSTQQFLDALKIGIDLAVGKNGGKSDDALFERVVSIIKLIDSAKHEGQQAAASNLFSLKEEELRQVERLENRKIDWEKEKWQTEQDNNAKTVDLVKVGLETFKEPIGNIISTLGQAGANSLRGKANATCPSCSKPFFVDPSLEQVTCPNCGVGLAKQSPQASQKAVEVPSSLRSPETHPEPVNNKLRDETTDEEVRQAYAK